MAYIYPVHPRSASVLTRPPNCQHGSADEIRTSIRRHQHRVRDQPRPVPWHRRPRASGPATTPASLRRYLHVLRIRDAAPEQLYRLHSAGVAYSVSYSVFCPFSYPVRGRPGTLWTIRYVLFSLYKKVILFSFFKTLFPYPMKCPNCLKTVFC